MVPSASSLRMHTWPRGQAARATRLVTSGTGGTSWGGRHGPSPAALVTRDDRDGERRASPSAQPGWPPCPGIRHHYRFFPYPNVLREGCTFPESSMILIPLRCPLLPPAGKSQKYSARDLLAGCFPFPPCGGRSGWGDHRVNLTPTLTLPSRGRGACGTFTRVMPTVIDPPPPEGRTYR
jgi:hypothetical protein